MREAARIQSFSDDFHFLGSRNEQAGQIGNAVPPYFMEQLADNIIDALQGKGEEYQQLNYFQTNWCNIHTLSAGWEFESFKKLFLRRITSDIHTCYLYVCILLNRFCLHSSTPNKTSGAY